MEPKKIKLPFVLVVQLIAAMVCKTGTGAHNFYIPATWYI